MGRSLGGGGGQPRAGRRSRRQICTFLLRLGVRGTPLNSYKFWDFDSAQAAAPAAPGRICRFAANSTLRRGSGGLRGVEIPKFVRI